MMSQWLFAAAWQAIRKPGLDAAGLSFLLVVFLSADPSRRVGHKSLHLLPPRLPGVLLPLKLPCFPGLLGNISLSGNITVQT